MTSNYLVNVYYGSTVIFSGMFTTDTSGLVQSFYETDSGDSSIDRLYATGYSYSTPVMTGTTDNVFNTSYTYDTGFGEYLTTDNVFSSSGMAVSVDQNSLINTYFNDSNGVNIDYLVLQFYVTYSNFGTMSNIFYVSCYEGTSTYLNSYSYTYTVTAADTPCFNEGTKILCLNKNFEEKYVPIEKLRKGDIVKSYKHGYRKIDLIGKGIMINNSNINNNRMYKMIKTEKNGLIKDLLITGGHSILVDDLGSLKEENEKIIGEVKIDDKYLLLASVSKDFIKIKENKEFTYYHFVLENNGDDNERFGVWANGILTETTSRNHFVNHKYTLI